MLDPVVVSALIVLAAYGLKWLAGYFGIPLDETTLNSIAAAFVAYLLSLFGLGVIHRASQNTRLAAWFGDMKKQ